MTKQYCPVKDKQVKIAEEKLNASTLEDRSHEQIGGHLNCSDNDYLCEDDRCPIKNMRN